jgi:hypothetical protein
MKVISDLQLVSNLITRVSTPSFPHK